MKFLVDVNLPRNFKFFNRSDFFFVSDLNVRTSDSEIWNHAIENDFVILTKDTDFFSRSLLSQTKPKVIYFRIGNMKIDELHRYFEIYWKQLEKAIENNFLVIADTNKVSIIF